MRLPNQITKDVERLARFHYLDKHMCQAWNLVRTPGELRLLTGWVWQSKTGNRYQMGLKTRTAAVRDAYYVLIEQRSAPGIATRIRRVA